MWQKIVNWQVFLATLECTCKKFLILRYQMNHWLLKKTIVYYISDVEEVCCRLRPGSQSRPASHLQALFFCKIFFITAAGNWAFHFSSRPESSFSTWSDKKYCFIFSSFTTYKSYFLLRQFYTVTIYFLLFSKCDLAKAFKYDGRHPLPELNLTYNKKKKNFATCTVLIAKKLT